MAGVQSFLSLLQLIYRKHFNFFRVHLLAFIVLPLIGGSFIYAFNDEFPIDFVDALFLAFSAQSVCGLTTADLSQLAPAQNAILFIHMLLGNPIIVSWLIVFIRRAYIFRKHRLLLQEDHDIEMDSKRLSLWIPRFLQRSTITPSSSVTAVSTEDTLPERYRLPKMPPIKRVDTSMIKRLEHVGIRLVDPNGRLKDGDGILSNEFSPSSSSSELKVESSNSSASGDTKMEAHDTVESLPTESALDHFRAPTGNLRASVSPERPPTRASVEFAQQDLPTHHRRSFDSDKSNSDCRSRLSIPNVMTQESHVTIRPTRLSGMGGFAMPHELLIDCLSRKFPAFKRKIGDGLTVPRTMTIKSQNSVGPTFSHSRPVPYLKDSDAITVGRNSNFLDLSQEQAKEMARLEYRALSALLWIVALYHIGIQIISFGILTIYMAYTPEFASALESPLLHRSQHFAWYSLFHVVAAYTNAGLSLVDTSLIPFQQSKLILLLTTFLVLAGNTAFPIFLRMFIFIGTKIIPRNCRLFETLHFIMDHPRRCYIYLFPTTQTWLLFGAILFLNAMDLVGIIVLDVHVTAVSALSGGVVALSSLTQAVSVRAAGFTVLPLYSLVPAVKILLVITMYISIYPVAMSVRATNVYEEQSLGVFELEKSNDMNPEDDVDKARAPFDTPGRAVIWGKYLSTHAKDLLSFDMWSLALAVFVVCWIEREHLENTDEWFNIFQVIFELVSAYSSVGLSLGLPTANYSFSGSFRAPAKIIVILVMVRGRHRGLPMAIDRAVLIPKDFSPSELMGHDQLQAYPLRGRDSTRRRMFEDGMV